MVQEKEQDMTGVVGYYVKKGLDRGKVLQANDGLKPLSARTEKVPDVKVAPASSLEQEMIDRELKRAVTLSRDNGI